MDITCFRKKIVAWGKENFRPYPWRLSGDPYRILIAELMLHRTQARQVSKVYEVFVSRYQDVFSLAQASEQELETSLYSLGLRWRTSLIRRLVLNITERFSGIVPESKEELMSLPGVSDYVASAVRCFAWNHPEAVIDTNTVRVVGRLYNLTTKDSSRRSTRFRNLIAELVDPKEPRMYNYALLDLADTICTKRRLPSHSLCPVLELCLLGMAQSGGENQTIRQVECKQTTCP